MVLNRTNNMDMTQLDKKLKHILYSYYICTPLYQDILDCWDFDNYKILKSKVMLWI